MKIVKGLFLFHLLIVETPSNLQILVELSTMANIKEVGLSSMPLIKDRHVQDGHGYENRIFQIYEFFLKELNVPILDTNPKFE